MSVAFENCSVVIASGNREVLRNEKDMILQTGFFSQYELAFNGGEAYELSAKVKPDLLLIDLVMPVMDGYGVLEALANDGLLQNIAVIVTSGIYHDYIARKAFDYGADYFLVKPTDFEVFRDRIRDVMERKKRGVPAERMSSRQKLLTEITVIIQRLGVPASCQGFGFLRTAIELSISDPKMLDEVTKRMYPTVAEIYGSTPSRVERNMRHAIETAWSRGDIAYMEKLFGYTVDAERGKPTNSAFIAAVTDYIHLQNLRVD